MREFAQAGERLFTRHVAAVSQYVSRFCRDRSSALAHLHFSLDSFVRGDSTRIGGARRMPAQRLAPARRWAPERDRIENHCSARNLPFRTLPGDSETWV